jgi:hypothetical protein
MPLLAVAVASRVTLKWLDVEGQAGLVKDTMP